MCSMVQIDCCSATDWGLWVAPVPLSSIAVDLMNLPKWVGRDNCWGFFHELGENHTRGGDSTVCHVVDSTCVGLHLCWTVRNGSRLYHGSIMPLHSKTGAHSQPRQDRVQLTTTCLFAAPIPQRSSTYVLITTHQIITRVACPGENGSGNPPMGNWMPNFVRILLILCRPQPPVECVDAAQPRRGDL